MLKASMRVRFWGVRGSIPCPGPSTIRYGGNTPCIEVRCGGHVLIFDAGTGLRSLGIELLKDPGIRDVDIFITHCHLDHVSGLPFFTPFFRKNFRVRVWAGNLKPSNSIERVMRSLMSSPWFPVPMDIFKAKIEFQDFKSGDLLRPHDDITLRTALLDHPDGTNGYRLEYGGRAFALLCDTEGFPGKRDSEMVDLARHADLALYDSTFTESEIVSKAGWGHSTWMRGVHGQPGSRSNRRTCRNNRCQRGPDYRFVIDQSTRWRSSATRPGCCLPHAARGGGAVVAAGAGPADAGL